MADPTFILAPPRSFSTVVCSMLGQRPQLYGLPEIHLVGTESVGEFLQQCAEATFPWPTASCARSQFRAGAPSEYWMRVRGEDVLGAPEVFLAHIARWLGVRCDRKAIKEMKHPERSPYACYGPSGARFGNDRLFLDSPALRPEPVTH